MKFKIKLLPLNRRELPCDFIPSWRFALRFYTELAIKIDFVPS